MWLTAPRRQDDGSPHLLTVIWLPAPRQTAMSCVYCVYLHLHLHPHLHLHLCLYLCHTTERAVTGAKLSPGEKDFQPAALGPH